jgi:hypothetical protein
MVWLQDSISNHLHHHTVSNILLDKIYEAHHAWILSCSNLGMGDWLIIRPIFLAFQLSSLVFSTTFQMWFRLPHFSLVGIFWFVCTHPIDPMGIHLLHCTHGNKHMQIHDGIHDIFFIIAWDVGFYVGWKQLHALFSTTFNFSHWQINIVLTKDGICTLADIVIANPIWVDLFPRFCATYGFATSNTTQAKKMSYCDWHPVNQFFLLAIEIFGCLHK